jgi:hypothetical protein
MNIGGSRSSMRRRIMPPQHWMIAATEKQLKRLSS